MLSNCLLKTNILNKGFLIAASICMAPSVMASPLWQGTANYLAAPGHEGDESRVGPFDTYDFGTGVALIVRDGPSNFTGYYQTYVTSHQLNGMGINVPQLDVSGGTRFSGTGNDGFELTLRSVFHGAFTNPSSMGQFTITGGRSDLYFDTNPNYSFISDSGFGDGSAILGGPVTGGAGIILPGRTPLGIGVNQLELSFNGVLGFANANVYDPDTISGGTALFSINLNNPRFLSGINSVMGHNARTGMLASADGSLALIPVPAAVWLLGSALVGLISLSGRRQPEEDRESQPV